MGNFDDGVEMVGHDDPFVKLKFRADLFRSQPFFYNDLTQFVEGHVPVVDLSEKAVPLVGAGGDEVETCAAIVMTR